MGDAANRAGAVPRHHGGRLSFVANQERRSDEFAHERDAALARADQLERRVEALVERLTTREADRDMIEALAAALDQLDDRANDGAGDPAPGR